MKKRNMLLCLVLVCCLLTTSALAVKTNEKAVYALVVDKVEWAANPKGGRDLIIHLKNTGKQAVYAVGISMTLLDDQGELVFVKPMDAMGYYEEMQWGITMTAEMLNRPVAPGATTKNLITIDASYEKVTKAQVGINYYQTSGGDGFFIMPESILWKTTDGEEIAPTVKGKYLPGFTKAQQKKADSLSLGLMLASSILTEERAPLYGQKAGGAFVIDRTKEGLVQKIGLKIGDLLTTVDGIRLVDDPRALYLGKVKLAEGKKVTFQWKRGDEAMENTITAK